jgi:hypothetical protein
MFGLSPDGAESGESLTKRAVIGIGNRMMGCASEAVMQTGRSSYTMVDVEEELGITVKIAHRNQAKAMARAKIKTDKRDSMVLAHLLRMNIIPEMYRRSAESPNGF